MDKIIEVKDLYKSYGTIKAVQGINFYVERGKLFAFLGQNGAGKSTTIDMICTLLQPDDGEVMIDGHKLGKENDAIRNSIGVVFQDSLLDKLLTVRENLTTRAKFYHMSKSEIKKAVQSAAVAADVMEFIDRPYGKLSGGQRRRADIARALVNTPKILFLDEPTTGLDPKTKEDVWKTITQLQKSTGMTVFLTTHYMEEAATADYIIIIEKGKIAVKGTPYELRDEYSFDTVRIKLKKETDNSKQLENLFDKFQMEYTFKNGIFTAKIGDTMDALPLLNEAEPIIENFEVVHGSMQDVFLKITGEKTESN
jgi:multidrug/hemolysin transport system ATP-binding protein